MASQFTDLAEHTGTLIAIIGALSVIAFGLVRWFANIVTNIAVVLKADIFKMIEGLDNRIGTIWVEIGEINKRQLAFRVEVPKDYIRVGGAGYMALKESLGRIEAHSEQLAIELRNQQTFISTELHKQQDSVAKELQKRHDLVDKDLHNRQDYMDNK